MYFYEHTILGDRHVTQCFSTIHDALDLISIPQSWAWCHIPVILGFRRLTYLMQEVQKVKVILSCVVSSKPARC